MQQLEIRPAAAADFTAVGDLCVAAYAPFLLGDRNHYVPALRDVAGRAAVAEVLVASDPENGGILGTVTLVPDGGPMREIAGPSEAEFRMLAVDPAAQGRGVGATLLRRVLDEARAHGKGVVCSSLPEMLTAHRVYRRLGFHRAPERDWSPVAGVDLITFVRPLLRYGG